MKAKDSIQPKAFLSGKTVTDAVVFGRYQTKAFVMFRTVLTAVCMALLLTVPAAAAIETSSPNIPVDQPLPTPPWSWVSNAVSDIMSFSYTDYQRRLQQSSKHFTKAGWESFAASIQRTRIIDLVAAQQLMVSGKVDAPQVIQEGAMNGKYIWVVQMPLTITYQGKETHTDKAYITLVIDRENSPASPDGLAIAKWTQINAELDSCSPAEAAMRDWRNKQKAIH